MTLNALPGEDAFVAGLTGDDALVARRKYRLIKDYEANGARASIREVGRFNAEGCGFVNFSVTSTRPDPRVPPSTDPTKPVPMVIGSTSSQTFMFRGFGQ